MQGQTSATKFYFHLYVCMCVHIYIVKQGQKNEYSIEW